MSRYEVVQLRVWQHPDGRKASVFGALPWHGENDGWEQVPEGFTLRDTKTQEVGRPYGLLRIDGTDHAAVQALADKLNAEEKEREAFADWSPFNMDGTIYFRSAPRRIGKHEWRMVVYQAHHRIGKQRAFIGYEWRRLDNPDRWRRDEDWPRYDWNRHNSGLPKTLRKIWEEHEDERKEALAKAA